MQERILRELYIALLPQPNPKTNSLGSPVIPVGRSLRLEPFPELISAEQLLSLSKSAERKIRVIFPRQDVPSHLSAKSPAFVRCYKVERRCFHLQCSTFRRYKPSTAAKNLSQVKLISRTLSQFPAQVPVTPRQRFFTRYTATNLNVCGGHSITPKTTSANAASASP